MTTELDFEDLTSEELASVAGGCGGGRGGGRRWRQQQQSVDEMGGAGMGDIRQSGSPEAFSANNTNNMASSMDGMPGTTVSVRVRFSNSMATRT